MPLVTQVTYLDADPPSHSYCFYTGSGPRGVLERSDFIPRSLAFATPHAQGWVHESQLTVDMGENLCTQF